MREQIDADKPPKEALERLSVQVRRLRVQDQVLQRAQETPAKDGASAGDGVER